MYSYPNDVSIDEQLRLAERKFQELLKADVEFDELKLAWLKIKELQAKRNHLEPTTFDVLPMVT